MLIDASMAPIIHDGISINSTPGPTIHLSHEFSASSVSVQRGEGGGGEEEEAQGGNYHDDDDNDDDNDDDDDEDSNADNYKIIHDRLHTTSDLNGSGSRDQAQDVVGFSICQQWTRLTSPASPAPEKAAAVQEGAGFISFDDASHRSGSCSITPPESDCLAKSDTIPKLDPVSTSLSSADFNSTSCVQLGHVSLDAIFSPSILLTVEEDIEAHKGSVSATEYDDHGDKALPRRRSTASVPAFLDAAISIRSSNSAARNPMKEPQSNSMLHARPQQLRRVSSEGSISLGRALSRASSLGDDARFQNVKEQANSRLKAIRDSLQDSNFRLPKVPQLPNMASMAKFPGVLSVVTWSPQRDQITSAEGSKTIVPVERRESLLDSLRKKAESLTWNPILTEKPSASTASATETLTVPHNLVKNSTAATAAASDTASGRLVDALKELKGDLVILGGYRGSVLRENKTHQRVWVPFKAGLHLQKVDLEIGLGDDDEDNTPIYPNGMLTHIGPVDISRRLFKRLRGSENFANQSLRVHDYGYDWRRSPHKLSAELIAFLQTLECNAPATPKHARGAWLIAHSLGGLITRHAVNRRPDLFAGVLYAGTPQNCPNILGPLKDGDSVLLSTKVLTAQTNFTFRSSFVLLPLSGKLFVDEKTKEELPVDFFDANNWTRHELSPVLVKFQHRRSTLLGHPISFPRSIGQFMQKVHSRYHNSTRNYNPHENAATPSPLATDIAVDAGVTTQMNNHNASWQHLRPRRSTTIPQADAVDYLRRILPQAKQFKIEGHHIEAHTLSNAYPPLAVIYGKTEPTVSATRVAGYEGICKPDVYDNLNFASGDGVVLAREAMLPDGYKAVKGGVIGTDRGHISILGDLEAVGRTLTALIRARGRGVGMGAYDAINDSPAPPSSP